MLIALSIIILLAIGIAAFMQQAKFGRMPRGARLERIRKSPNYKNGAFANLNHTPALAEGVTYFQVMKDVFFGKKVRVQPSEPLPSVKTDLKALGIDEDVLVWFGHSSYFIQVDGRRILVDPVFSGSASPLPIGTKAFKGADIYTPDDMPAIDYLFISHDHWDHLDYDTITRLRPKIKTVICGLGTGEHLERWGYNPNMIIEKDWNEEIMLEPGFKAIATPARHFSGRTFVRNRSLWMSYALQTPGMKLFIGGDSGYDTHFAEIGKKFGPFDLAILENGQYNANWKYIHMMPGEIFQAAKDLKARRIFPVHAAKFSLSTHAWDEPLQNVAAQSAQQAIPVITPMIGEKVNLKDDTQVFSQWWKGIQ